MSAKQLQLDVHEELIIDNFAGGGGASTGIELALGRRVNIAINHDEKAVAMHRANHPETEHYCESVWDVKPRELTQGRPVGLVWLSPDCKHFSKAKGGKPVEKKIRGLAWIALRWAATVRPRVIMLENVEEFTTWGPLIVDEDGNARPCPKRKGKEFNVFVNALRRQGYEVEYKELRASDYATPTIRKRLFLIARRDGQPIVWPEAVTADPTKKSGLKPWRTAAEIIDWTIPCPSIFLSKEEGRLVGVKRPLAEATLRRIARGVMRYVVNAAEPFIVNTRNGERDGQAPRVRGMNKPFWTITAQGSQHAVISAFLAKHYTGVVGADVRDPLPTATCQDHNAVVAANLVHLGHGEKSASGAPRWSHGVRDAAKPLNTVTAQGMPAGVVTSHLVKLRNNQDSQSHYEPIPTLTAGGGHVGEVRAFLVKYYGTDQDPQLREPLHTVTTKDRYGLVTVAGQEYAIADIGMRMLTPRELFRAQGFPEDYIIEWGLDEHGKRITLTKTEQVRMCGNSVCPPVAAALVKANLDALAIREKKAA